MSLSHCLSLTLSVYFFVSSLISLSLSLLPAKPLSLSPLQALWSDWSPRQPDGTMAAGHTSTRCRYGGSTGAVHSHWKGAFSRQCTLPLCYAAMRCSDGRATLLVTTLPLLRTRYISEFSSRADLMRVVMASAHIPVVLDWRMFVRCRGSACVDGGLW